MPNTPISVNGPEVAAVIAQAKADAAASPRRTIDVGGSVFATPFPSPEDWRDRWIYFLLVDRFNNPVSPPRAPDPSLPYQGGTFEGIRQQVPYIKALGAGAVWISPVLMNPPWFGDYYGGYAAQDFLRIEPRFCQDPAAARTTPELADQELRTLVDTLHAAGMHVILDLVLNHAGNLFNYEGAQDSRPWNPSGAYQTYWRDATGTAQGGWTAIESVAGLARDAGVWPVEAQQNAFFRRQGNLPDNASDLTKGDFGILKELKTELQAGDGTYPVRNFLIRACQYLVAKFDLDGFRVDTLQYVERDFARTFANAMREFALSIGKKNFFTFGEVWQDDDEAIIAEYIGRDTNVDDVGIVGFDAALDFPMRKRLEAVCKAAAPPAELSQQMAARLAAQKDVLSSHGDVGAYLVTFLENHDLTYRYAVDCLPAQVTLALTCLYTLQGIPCLYYGMEQGMNGSGATRESARACLWSIPNAFTRAPQHAYYQAVASLSALRLAQPALRYGRQYFRPLTGDGVTFGFSPYAPGVLAYSRILNDTEVVVVANTSKDTSVTVKVQVDGNLTPVASVPRLLFSNLRAGASAPGAIFRTSGSAVVPVTLRPMEAQVFG
jgi:glycosidase